MQIPTNSITYSTSGTQQMLAALLDQEDSDGGQDLQSAKEPGKGPPLGPPPRGDAAASNRFSTDTLSSLLSVQQQPPAASDIASKLIGDADSDGDGSLSLDEIKAALNGGGASQTGSTDDGLTPALAKLDTDGDGKLSSSELTSALESQHAAHKHGGHHHHAAAATEAPKATTPDVSLTETAAEETAAAASAEAA